MKKQKTKKRNYFSIVVCKAGDIDGYHVSVMDMDYQNPAKMYATTGSVLKSNSTRRDIAIMVGEFVLDLMEFKI